MDVKSVTRDLVAKHGDALDIKREMSYGRTAKTMVEATQTGIKLGWKIINKTGQDQIIYIAPSAVLGYDFLSLMSGQTAIQDKNGLPIFNSTDANADVRRTDLSAKLQISPTKFIFVDGKQMLDEENPDSALTITSTDADKSIDDFVGHASYAPLQITSFHLKSRRTDGTPDDSNYENPIVAYHFSPFYDTIKEEFNLRVLQDSRMNSPQFAFADFTAKNFPALVSQENIIAIKINDGTELAINAGIGAQASLAQRLYRLTSKANKALHAFRRVDQ